MKIIALQAENFKRLKAVEIRPDGNLVQITGKNGNGKSSVLDALWVVLAGSSVAPVKPIRDGAAQARIRVDLGEIVVTRTFKTGKDGETTTKITVENADGAALSSPQSVLDALLGQLTFDPVAFERMDARKQFDTLRLFVPGIDFDAIETANKQDYESRRDLNRRAKEERTLAEKIQVPAGTPEAPIDDAELLNQMEKASKHNQDIETRKSNREKLRKEADGLRADIERLRQEIDEKIKAASAIETKLKAAPSLPAPVDVAEIRRKIDASKETNAAVALREKQQAHAVNAEKLESAAAELTAAMEKRQEEKEAAIRAAKLPVPGISFGDGFVMLNGQPFEQASDAERLQASIAIAMAMNPKLRVIRVRDGGRLDEDSLKMLEEMARDKDYQVWLERVDSSGKVGFVLEDGQLKNAEAVAVSAVDDDEIL